MTFLERLYTNKDTYPYDEMLEILKGQTIKTKIPLLLPGNVVITNKTGELETVENDIGIVFNGKCDFAIAILTNKSTNTAKTRQTISKFTKAIFDITVEKSRGI